MNGRIYDPLLGRFLSADIMVDDLDDLQSFNRYSYVKNRPLTLVDPSGFAPTFEWDGDWFHVNTGRGTNAPAYTVTPVNGGFVFGTKGKHPMPEGGAAAHFEKTFVQDKAMWEKARQQIASTVAKHQNGKGSSLLGRLRTYGRNFRRSGGALRRSVTRGIPLVGTAGALMAGEPVDVALSTSGDEAVQVGLLDSGDTPHEETLNDEDVKNESELGEEENTFTVDGKTIRYYGRGVMQRSGKTYVVNDDGSLTEVSPENDSSDDSESADSGEDSSSDTDEKDPSVDPGQTPSGPTDEELEEELRRKRVQN